MDKRNSPITQQSSQHSVQGNTTDPSFRLNTHRILIEANDQIKRNLMTISRFLHILASRSAQDRGHQYSFPKFVEAASLHGSTAKIGDQVSDPGRATGGPPRKEQMVTISATATRQVPALDIEQGLDTDDKEKHYETKPLLRKTHAGGVNGAERKIAGGSVELVSGICYCAASCGMILLNKFVLSSFDFHAPNSLLFFQCALAVVMVTLGNGLGVLKLDPWDLRVVKLWWPVNIIFVGMIWTGFYALKNLGVAMVTLLKNLTNFVVIIGDLVIFRKTYNKGVWFSLCLMVLSAFVGVATDLSFSKSGYTWQLVNCLFTGSYSLYLKSVMERISVVTAKSKGLEEASLVLYNNLLSLPWIFLLMLYFGETETLWTQPALRQPGFLFAAFCSGLLGFGISFASLWFLSNTTVTTYSLVGSLNKIPTAMLGTVLFGAPMRKANLLSVLVGLSAGVVFVMAKSRNR